MITRRRLMIAGSLAALAAALRWTPLGAAEKAPIPALLYKTPGCECCEGYAAYLEQHGFAVTVKETDTLASISAKAGIPAELEGCHTAFISDYVVDGHAPVEAVQKLLAEHPALAGLTVPGMPPGSPGMGGEKQLPLIVYAIDKQGEKSVYMTL